MAYFIGKQVTFSYTGNVQNITLYPGKYKFQCYGARGGNGYGKSAGGYGGYTEGVLVVTKETQYQLYIGQAGQDGNTRRSSYNGGAIGGYDTYGGTENGGSGGGATDIRLDASLQSRIMVAGGGGGAGGWSGCPGGAGGLETGLNEILGTGTVGINNQSGGGGGGGYYGGNTNGSVQSSYYVGRGAFGGSSYVDNEKFENTTKTSGINSGNGYIIMTVIERTTYNNNESDIYNYTGGYHSITLKPGKYKMECYGAAGGIGNGNINPIGKGGYTSGELNVTVETMVYIYPGQNGIDNYQYSQRFNGGGAAINAGGHNGGAGGGASDVRLMSGSWNNTDSLKSRILVAGGGGGAQPSCGNTATAGHGGNVIGGTSYNQGYQGRPAATAATRAYSTGGTQTTGGKGYNVNDSHTSIIGSGGFGYGAASVQCGAGGGGGWYGGGTGYTSGGGGGSSYAAGDTQCSQLYLISHQNNTHLENIEYRQGINTGAGYVIFTYLANQVLYINCHGDTNTFYGGEHVIVNTGSLHFIDGFIREFKEYQIIGDINISNLIIHNNESHTLEFDVIDTPNASIEIMAIYEQKARLNTDMYKNFVQQTVFDFQKLLE